MWGALPSEDPSDYGLEYGTFMGLFREMIASSGGGVQTLSTITSDTLSGVGVVLTPYIEFDYRLSASGQVDLEDFVSSGGILMVTGTSGVKCSYKSYVIWKNSKQFDSAQFMKTSPKVS